MEIFVAGWKILGVVDCIMLRKSVWFISSGGLCVPDLQMMAVVKK